MISIFRNVKINSKDEEFEAVLYKNFREPLCRIPNEYITEIQYNLKDYCTLSLEVRDKVVRNGRIIDNPLYDKFKGKRFIVINDEERYIIDDIKITSDKDISIKKIEAQSFEYDLKTRDVSTLEGTYQLYKDKNDKINVEDGVLNWLEKETTWKVGYIDPDAKCTTGLYPETIDTTLYESLKVANVQNNMILYEKDIKADIEDKIFNFRIKYNNIKSTDIKSNISKTESKEHKFEKFAQPVTHIKATYKVDKSYNTIIEYEFTLKDGFIQKETKDFAYLQNLDVEIEGVYFTYETGNKVIKSKVKYRSFEKNTQKWMSFMREVLEDSFNCIFQFDTVNKRVNVIAKENLGRDNGFYLYYNQYLMKLEKDLRVSEVVTRLVVEGKDRLGISGVNPLGTNYVEDFTYLLAEDNISFELKEALMRYQNLCDENFKEWEDLKKQKTKKSEDSVYMEAKIQELRSKINAKKSIEVAYIRMGEDIDEMQKEEFKTVSAEVNDLNSQLNSLMKDFTNLKDEIKDLDLRMKDLNSKIDKKSARDLTGKIFTDEDLLELDECIYSESMQDDYYTDEEELYNNAKRVLRERNVIPISFSADVMGITKHPRGWKNLIRLGDKAYIVDKDDNLMKDGEVNIVAFKYTPPRQNTYSKIENIEFNNEAFALHDLKSIRNISVRKINYNKAAISYWKNTWVDSAINNKMLGNIQKDGIDTSLVAISSKSDVNDMDITGSGVWCTDKSDNTTNKQIYLGSGFMAVTDNNWDTCRTVADEKGVVAKSIFGTALVGDRMNLANNKNTFRIDEKGVSIYDEENLNLKARLGFYESDGVTKFSFLMYDKNGKIKISDDGMSQINMIPKSENVSKNTSFYMPLYLNDSVKDIRELKMFIHLSKFRSDVAGILDVEKVVTTKINSDDNKSFILNDNNITSSLDYIDINNQNKRENLLNLYEDDYHNHIVDISHNHKIDYSIIETTLPSNVVLKVNDVIVAQNINEDMQIDIKEYVSLNKLNRIEITSETNGRIDAMIFLNSFVSI